MKKKGIKNMNLGQTPFVNSKFQITDNVNVVDTGWINTINGGVYRSITATVVGANKVEPAPDKSMEIEMNTNDFEREQRNFLKRELTVPLHDTRDALRIKHHIEVDNPKTVEDFIDRIKNGKYKLVDKNDRNPWESPHFHIDWRIHERDEEGYKKAYAELNEDYETAVQDTMILPIEKALESVRKFRKKHTVH